jgi:hypothetical protein
MSASRVFETATSAIWMWTGDMARVADDLRANPNCCWAVAHEIGA